MAIITRRQALALPLAAAGLSAAPPRLRFEELRRMAAPEANQAVAADERFLYAIGNQVIGKYDKKTGKRVAIWECEPGKPLTHLDSGVIHNGVLYCAHSNYPGVPMVSSIEMWRPDTLQHSGTFSFGVFAGSATWVDFHKDSRYVTFAHYQGKGDEPGRDAHWTTLIRFDSEWRQRDSWVYPEEVVSRLGKMSISGGVFTPDGRLLCTGHDNPELYIVKFPDAGPTLTLEAIIPTTIHGQGISLDPTDPPLLHGIHRPTHEIVTGRLLPA